MCLFVVVIFRTLNGGENGNGPEKETAPGDQVDADAPGGQVDAAAPGCQLDADAPGDQVDADAPGGQVDAAAPGCQLDADAPGGQLDADAPDFVFVSFMRFFLPSSLFGSVTYLGTTIYVCLSSWKNIWCQRRGEFTQFKMFSLKS